jgi:asparagine synthase (glutamine-hydrolysing)
MPVTDHDIIPTAPWLTRLYGSNEPYSVEHFQPGTYSEFRLSVKVSSSWKPHRDAVAYHSVGFISTMFLDKISDQDKEQDIRQGIQAYVKKAVQKRCLVTERPIACLLSGGLDSSLITALVNEFHKEHNTKPLETYSIGLANSVDLVYAKQVAEYLGTNHHEIVLTEQDFLDAIPEVIAAIESYDTTTVRASIGNYLLGKYIAKHSDAKVIFNGDGSDELTGGYLYMGKCPCAIEFDKESRRLLKDIHMFDVLRSDKSISSHGLEPRTPFLDRSWVNYYLSISPTTRFHVLNNKQCEKFLLRNAFSPEHYLNCDGKPLLPDSVLWRRKEAFSDGVSGQSRSLFEIIQEYVDGKIDDKEFGENSGNYTHNTPKTKEQYYYRKLFEGFYPDSSNVVPYFWMPKYVAANDASARTLAIY